MNQRSNTFPLGYWRQKKVFAFSNNKTLCLVPTDKNSYSNKRIITGWEEDLTFRFNLEWRPNRARTAKDWDELVFRVSVTQATVHLKQRQLDMLGFLIDQGSQTDL